MNRTHVSKASDKALIIRPEKRQEIDFKPAGFWYSVDGDWERWCASEQPDWLEGRNLYGVTLRDERMLEIRTVFDLDHFHEQYKTDRPGMPVLQSLRFIDWPRVAAEYDGIEIAPYLWQRRLDGEARWYYSWDCASGCIWMPRGVKVERMGRASCPKVKTS